MKTITLIKSSFTLLTTAALLTSAAQPADSPLNLTFTTIDIPGAVQSDAAGINNSGVIVGSAIYDPNGKTVRGFKIENDGITYLTPPGNSPFDPLNQMNDRGIAVGGVSTATEFWLSYLYMPDGTTRFLPQPNLGLKSWGYMLAINNRGTLAGFGGSDTTDGFQPLIYEDGKYTRLAIPGAIFGVAWGINDRNQVVGWYVDGAGLHDFIKTGDVYKTVEPTFPGQAFSAINNLGLIVGFYFDDAGMAHGLIYDNGQITTVDVPGYRQTMLYGVNDHGQAVGLGINDQGLTTACVVTISRSGK